MQYCMGVAEEAKEMLESKLEEKRKLAKKEGKSTIEEDDPVKVSVQRICLIAQQCLWRRWKEVESGHDQG